MTIHIKEYNELPQIEADELEVTTIGVGSQAGESVVIHLGNGKWAIIDSCKTVDGDVLPLLHLKSLGINFDDVDKIVCTHWHQDHIGGLTQVVKECRNADFYFPIIGQDNNFLRLLLKGDEAQNKSSVWHEFIECIKTSKKRHNFSGSDKLIYDNCRGIQLFTLSPSDVMVEEMLKIVALFNEDDSDYVKINDDILPPNKGCSALLFVTPDGNILLGADLEANRSPKDGIDSCIGECNDRDNHGWCNVHLRSSSFSRRDFMYFKLPHHASKTGYCNAVWTKHKANEVISTSTVFINNAGVKLPQKDMLEKYHSLCTSMYLTSRGPQKKDRGNGKSKLESRRIPQIENVAVLKAEKGVVCSRKKKGQPWRTYLLGAAIKVDDGFIKQYVV